MCCANSCAVHSVVLCYAFWCVLPFGGLCLLLCFTFLFATPCALYKYFSHTCATMQALPDFLSDYWMQNLTLKKDGPGDCDTDPSRGSPATPSLAPSVDSWATLPPLLSLMRLAGGWRVKKHNNIIVYVFLFVRAGSGALLVQEVCTFGCLGRQACGA